MKIMSSRGASFAQHNRLHMPFDTRTAGP